MMKWIAKRHFNAIDVFGIMAFQYFISSGHPIGGAAAYIAMIVLSLVAEAMTGEMEKSDEQP